MNIRVSAIVSTFNAAEFFPGCINDLEQQSIANQLEIIVIDSGSYQNEGEIVRELQERYGNIVYLRTDSRETVYSAWNRGIQIARGRYITNANTDDRHRFDAFERMASFLDLHPNISLVYADLIKTNKKNETFNICTPSGRFRWPDWDRNKLMSKGCFVGPQPMWRRNVHEIYGFFEKSFITSGDYEFWLRISQTLEFYHLRETLGIYLENPSSIEHRNLKQKTIEDSKILSCYFRAAKNGKIIKFNPLANLQKILNNQAEFNKKEFLDTVDMIINNGHNKNHHSDKYWYPYNRDIEIFYELKMRILSGNRRNATVKQFLDSIEKLVLKSTKWYSGFQHSINNTCLGSFSLKIKDSHNFNRESYSDHVEEYSDINENSIIEVKSDENTAFALRHYEEALKSQPEDINFKKKLAACYWIGFRRFEDALKLYVEIFKTHPDDIESLNAVAIVCRSLGFEADAQLFRKRAIELRS